jgi:hypothetical protein
MENHERNIPGVGHKINVTAHGDLSCSRHWNVLSSQTSPQEPGGYSVSMQVAKNVSMLPAIPMVLMVFPQSFQNVSNGTAQAVLQVVSAPG